MLNHGTATFMILGVCTRVLMRSGARPARAVDTAEPVQAADAIKTLDLNCVVITQSIATTSRRWRVDLGHDPRNAREAVGLPDRSTDSRFPGQ